MYIGASLAVLCVVNDTEGHIHYEVNGVLVAAELLVTPVVLHPEGLGVTKSIFAMVIGHRCGCLCRVPCWQLD